MSIELDHAPTTESQRRSTTQRIAQNRPAVKAKLSKSLRAAWQRRRPRAPECGTRKIRRAWLTEKLEGEGGFNARMLMRHFKVCRWTAREDIKRFQARNPGMVAYDESAKLYRKQVAA